MRIFLVSFVVVIRLCLILWLVICWCCVLRMILSDWLVVSILGLGLALLVLWLVALLVLSLLGFLSQCQNYDILGVETFDNPLFAQINIDPQVKRVFVVPWWENADYLLIFRVPNGIDLCLKVIKVLFVLDWHLDPDTIALNLIQLFEKLFSIIEQMFLNRLMGGTHHEFSFFFFRCSLWLFMVLCLFGLLLRGFFLIMMMIVLLLAWIIDPF